MNVKKLQPSFDGNLNEIKATEDLTGVIIHLNLRVMPQHYKRALK